MRDVVISRKPSIFAVLFHANFGFEKSIKVFTLTLIILFFHTDEVSLKIELGVSGPIRL